MRRFGLRITIPPRVNAQRSGPFDRAIYRMREQVERLINRLKHNRRSATRYEKCAENYRAMWLIAATLLWLEHEALQTRPSSERCLRKHRGKWVVTPAAALRRPKSSTGGLSAQRALDNESSQRNERPAYVQRGPLGLNCGINRANPTPRRAWVSVGEPVMAALQHGG